MEGLEEWLEREVIAAKKESRPHPCAGCWGEVEEPDEEYCSRCHNTADKPD